jgi:hypothetical protein
VPAFWSESDPIDSARALVNWIRGDETYRETRRERVLKYASLYEGLQLSSLAPSGYAVSAPGTFWGTDTPIVRNTCHSVVDTFVSKIAAIDTPKAALLTTEGSWRDRRQAEDLERLIEAEFLSPKGAYATLHELWIHAFRIAAAATGTVAVRFFADSGKVGARIHDTLDMVSSADFRTVGIETWYEVEDLVEQYPDREMDIRASAKAPPTELQSARGIGRSTPDLVPVYEGWRGANGDTPGRYVATLDGDCEPLVSEVYEHERWPGVWLGVIPQLYGPYAHSLTHHAYESIFRDNVLLAAIDRSISKTNKSMTFVDRTRLEDPQSLDIVEDVVVIGTTGEYQPQHVSPAGFNAGHLDVAERHRSDAHSIPGVSEMHSAGRREPGVDSAIGQRFVAALINERFAAVQRRYVQAVAVDSARVILQVLCEIYQEDRKLTRLWPGQDSLREVSAAVLKGVQSLKYRIQPAAVSGSKNTPADRQQTAFELFKSGILSPDAYAGLQQGGYDLPEELDSRDTPREWMDQQMHRWSFASDEEIAKPDFYRPPLKHLDPKRLLLQVIDGLLEAQMADLEPERQEFFVMCLADLDAMLPPPAPPAPPGPPPGPGGLPQGPLPMAG